MNKYPDHETYRKLYAKYYDGRDINQLLDLLEPLAGAQVIDLCAGDGRLALETLKRGANWALIVEREQTMVPSAVMDRTNPLNVAVDIASVYDALLDMPSSEMDRVVCRQAVNYWMDEETVRLVARVLKSGGIFAFNTFNEKPSGIPRVKEYVYDKHYFAEISWLVGETVHHVQTRDGMEPHCTQFQWIPRELFRKLLSPYFIVHEEQHGKTSLYKCVKK